MTDAFLGCEVSVEVGGGLGCLNEVTISACDIKDLKIIARPSETMMQVSNAEGKSSMRYSAQRQAQQSFQKVHDGQEQIIPKPQQQQTTGNGLNLGGGETPQQAKRKPRTSVGETLAHGTHSSTSRDQGNDWQRPYQPSYMSHEYSSPRRNDKYGNDSSRTPGKRERRRNRDETTFGTPIDDDMLSTEFDFEKNLALFDKQAVIEEIQSLKPDVVRQADRYTEKKYRCDENVLPSKFRMDDFTNLYNKCRLWTAGTFSWPHSLTSTGDHRTAATEVILSLSGGNHRLGPGNSHQPPVVVLLCGCHVQGAAGVNAARQLESHGVRTVVVTPQLPTSPPPSLLLTHELQLYALTSGRTASDPGGIPATVDLIVDARLDHSGRAGEGGSGHTWLTSTTRWASNSRAPILALDPPSDLAAIPSTQPPLLARVLLCPSLPLAYNPARGKVYLINVPIPQQTFNAVGIKYVSPFGAKLVIPLHPYE
nr:enhancer of mRNA-decapping protein 3-like [Penaeus vannamei]